MLLALICEASCRGGPGANRISGEYNSKTGKLELLKYDANGDGIVDTWSYMDGARILRIEIDQDQNGTIDRWEYYGADQKPGNQKPEKIGLSRRNDGIEDAWSYMRPDGSLDRVEISTRRNRKVNRIEHYENNVVVRAEEDTDGDGKMDKWETFDGTHLTSVAFDTQHRGTPDRRLVYGLNGSARVEVDPTGRGQFIAQPEPRSTTPK
jgi:hypothetical protein